MEVVRERRWSVLQQSWPRGEFKRGELKPRIEAGALDIPQLEQMGAAITDLGRQRPVKATLVIALQLLGEGAIDHQQKIAPRCGPAMDPRAFQRM
jgi:hypothetical protein